MSLRRPIGPTAAPYGFSAREIPSRGAAPTNLVDVRLLRISLGERGKPSSQAVATIDDEKRSARIISMHRLIVTTFHRPFDRCGGPESNARAGTARTALRLPMMGGNCRRKL